MPGRRANGSFRGRRAAWVVSATACAAAACLFHSGVPLAADAAAGLAFRGIETRSFLGEPLDLRIALDGAPMLDVSANCFAVVDGPRQDGDAEGFLGPADLRITLTETRAARYLQVRGRGPYAEPVARFKLRQACPGEAVREQAFVVLLDPPPFSLAAAGGIVRDADAGTARARDTARTAQSKRPVYSAAAGRWTVRDGDTLLRLSRAIQPGNRARQAQYRDAMRALNPELAGVADDAPLVAGSLLQMPDLFEFSGILPHPVVVPPVSARAPAGPRGKMPAPTAKDHAAPVKPSSTPSAATKAPVDAAPAAKPSREVDAAKGAASVVASGAPAGPRQEGFRLRLSASEMDLSRSRNVTEAQRSLLREKQMILDADDQVAALLALKHTVKQLEMRLNEMQLRLTTTTAKTQPAAPPAPTAGASSIPPVPKGDSEKSAPAPAMPPPATSAATPVAARTAADAAPTPPVAAAVPAPRPTVAEQPPSAAPATSRATGAPPESVADYLPSPLVGAGLLAGLSALIAGWFWARRKRGDSSLQAALDRADQLRKGDGREQDARNAHSPDPSAGSAERVAIRANAAPAHDQRAVPAPASASPTTDESESFDVTIKLDAPLSLEETPARFDLDASPATTVDFPLGMEEKAGEDRVRRLQYMYERYPELMSHTVSIDDADSVLNAARLYYEEEHRDKACELLTFAVEERPQEIRFWLAQFEIFRLENMGADFSALAAKFHVLFSHTPAWPKVRHIGHELDPTNPLFAAAGRDALTGDLQFDPVAENWLNAPMDFTSEALMSDLRRALFDDHGVDRPDFESITARLSAGAETG